MFSNDSLFLFTHIFCQLVGYIWPVFAKFFTYIDIWQNCCSTALIHLVHSN